MSNYVQIEFQNISSEQSEILIANLSELGYEGFEEDENSLKAFIPENLFDETILTETTGLHNISFIKTRIEETNWNEVWESNFQPVIVDDFVRRTPWVALRADFHPPIDTAKFEIVITPKMSFGTGHHATTYMMIQQMRDIDFSNKSVFDFGTGTGVLAILAEKLGAQKVLATDNDEWSITNASENLLRNDCCKIELKLSSTIPADEQFDITLANINKNIILANLAQIKEQLEPGGIILLSGLLKEDEQDVLSASSGLGLKFISSAERSNWLCIRLEN